MTGRKVPSNNDLDEVCISNLDKNDAFKLIETIENKALFFVEIKDTVIAALNINLDPPIKHNEILFSYHDSLLDPEDDLLAIEDDLKLDEQSQLNP